MPTYDYQCQKCGREFEHFQRMSEEPLSECPFEECQGKVQRLMSAGSGVIFKGSGFYQTDYKNSGNGQNGAGKDSSSEGSKKDASEKKESPKKTESTADSKGGDKPSTSTAGA